MYSIYICDKCITAHVTKSVLHTEQMQAVCTTQMPPTHVSLPMQAHMYAIWHRRCQTMPASMSCQLHILHTQSKCSWLSSSPCSGVVVRWLRSHPAATFRELFWLQPEPGGCRRCSKNLYRFYRVHQAPYSREHTHETISSQPPKK